MKKPTRSKRIFPPGSTIGVLGSGQLGRMFTLAARRLGYRVHTFSPDGDTPTGQVADKEWTAAYTNKKKLRSFAKGVDVITFEFENIPIETIKVVSKIAPTRPNGKILHIAQHRLREKTYLTQIGVPVAPFVPVKSKNDLTKAIKKLGFPFVIKTANFGYDGKGQRKINSMKDVKKLSFGRGAQEYVAEKFIRFKKEVSVVGVRSLRGEFSHFGVIENEHQNHILDLSISPARVSKKVATRVLSITRKIMNKTHVVGVLCVEMFLTTSGKILVNELAPRPHNSGHLTLNGFSTNQFEQQCRAVCGLPLAAPHQWAPTAMVNLLGDLWKRGKPNWDKALLNPHVKLHLYGKRQARPGRKMGHLTASAKTTQAAITLAKNARKKLTR